MSALAMSVGGGGGFEAREAFKAGIPAIGGSRRLHPSTMPSATIVHAWRPVDPQTAFFDAFDFFTPSQPPARGDSSGVRVEAWR